MTSVRIICLPLLLLALTLTVSAQTWDDGPMALEVVGASTSTLEAPRAGSPLPQIQPERSWLGAPWPDSRVNFPPSSSNLYAGDVNGNGLTDLIQVFLRVPDERTPYVGRQVHKTLVFYGGNTTATPDQVVYARLIPVGDLNGDGFADAIGEVNGGARTFWRGSPEGYVDTGVAAPDTIHDISPFHNHCNVPVGFHDVDQDGFDDYIQSSCYNVAGTFAAVFGAATFEEVEVVVYEVSESVSGFTLNVADLDGRGPHVVRISNPPLGGDLRLEVLLLERSGSVQVVQSDVIANSPLLYFTGRMRLYLLDVTGDGRTEIVLYSDASSREWTAVFRALERHPLSEDLRFSTVPWLREGARTWPVGDLDGDGSHDFVSVDPVTGGVHIHYGPWRHDEGGVSVNLGTDAIFSAPVYQLRGSFGDITGNGRDDFPLNFSDHTHFGTRIVEGEEGSTSGFTRSYASADYYGIATTYTVTLGDLDGDGIDDFALVDALGRSPAIHIFKSGSGSSDVPDTVVALEGWSPYAMATGDFSGDGMQDVVVAWAHRVLTPDRGRTPFIYRSRVLLYPGGDFSNPAATEIAERDLFPNYDEGLWDVTSGISMLANVGDVNGNGADDLLLAVPLIWPEQRKAFLFFGGGEFGGSPDLTLNLDRSAGMSPGGVMAGLGDVNGDGIDDFAVGDLEAIYVYFGSRGGGPFSAPHLILRAAEIPGVRYAWFGASGIAAGDFNGNGYNDIAVLPGNFLSITSQEGAPGLHIFHGGPHIDEEVDKLIALPRSPLRHGEDQYQYLRANSGELTVLPDLTGNGANELFVGTYGATHGLLLLGGSQGVAPSALLHAPDQGAGLGAGNNYFAMRWHSAVGDFTGDGVINIILPQSGDLHRVGTPSHLYALVVPDVIPPQLPSPLADRQVRVLDPPLQIDLARAFVSPLGRPLTFTARVDEDHVSSDIRDDSILEVRPRSVGDAVVRIEARDEDGSIGVGSLRITVGEHEIGREAPLFLWLSYTPQAEEELEGNLVIGTTHGDVVVPLSSADRLAPSTPAAAGIPVDFSPAVVQFDSNPPGLGTSHRSVRIRRGGDAPLQVTSVSMPDGVSITEPTTARVQFIHAAASATPEGITLHLESEDAPAIADLQFMRATRYLDIPSGVILNVVVGPTVEGSEPVTVDIPVLVPGYSYQAVVTGDPLRASDESNSGDTDNRLRISMLEGLEKSPEPSAVTLRLVHAIPGVSSIAWSPTASCNTHGGYGVFPYGYQATIPRYIAMESVQFVLWAPGGETCVPYYFDLDVPRFLGTSVTMVASGQPGGISGSQRPPYIVAFDQNGGHLELDARVTGVEDSAEIPSLFALHGNYPNPFHPSTTVVFDLPETANVTVQIYDLLGRLVISRSGGILKSGFSHRVTIDAGTLSSGTYIYRVIAEGAAGRSALSGTMTVAK